MADHLGMPAPFPALVLAAEATERVRVGTYMLNAVFYRPALVARDIASTDLLTDGRLEVGLGAGHARQEFEAAGLPFGSGGERVAFVRAELGGREVEFNSTVPKILLNRERLGFGYVTVHEGGLEAMGKVIALLR